MKSVLLYPGKSFARFRFGSRLKIACKKLCKLRHVIAIDEKALSKNITATERLSLIAQGNLMS